MPQRRNYVLIDHHRHEQYLQVAREVAARNNEVEPIILTVSEITPIWLRQAGLEPIPAEVMATFERDGVAFLRGGLDGHRLNRRLEVYAETAVDAAITEHRQDWLRRNPTEVEEDSADADRSSMIFARLAIEKMPDAEREEAFIDAFRRMHIDGAELSAFNGLVQNNRAALSAAMTEVWSDRRTKLLKAAALKLLDQE